MRALASGLFLVIASLPLVAVGGRGFSLFSLPAGHGLDWRLVLEEGQVVAWRNRSPEPRLRRMMAAGLRVERGRPDRFKDIASTLDVDPKTLSWVLLDPRRKAIASGSGQVDGARVEAALREALGGLPWDALDAVLKAEPDHGEARLAAAEWALSQVPSARSSPSTLAGSLGWAGIQEIQAEAKAALERFLAVPDWPSQADLSAADPDELGAQLRRQRGPLWDPIQRMTRQLLDALAADPANPRLQENLAFVMGLQDLDAAERCLDTLMAFQPLPGQEWPPVPVIHAAADQYRSSRRWRDLQDRCSGWSRTADPLFLDGESWARHLRREGVLLALETTARSWLEGWEILLPALESLRKCAGGSYRDFAALALRGANLPDDHRFRDQLGRQLALPSLAAPPRPPGLPPWRIQMHGAEELAKLREAFDTHHWLLLWLPWERQFESWPQAGWQLALGDRPFQGGGGRMDLDRLADVMGSGRSGRLLKAWNRALQEPEAPGPRRQKIDLMLQRMPVKALEPVLAEDLRKAGLSAELGGWALDENLWFAEAQRAIPLLEAHLRHWPVDAERWKALAFWTAFIPRHRGPAQLGEELPAWQPDLSLRLCLPLSVHEAVGRMLTERKAWSALRAWFEPAWADLEHLPRKDSRALALNRDLRPYFRVQLERAYRELGLAGELRRLRESGPEPAAGP